MIEGIITKGIGGFYYVKTKDKLYETRARGLFREEKITPLVGDKVLIRINEDGSGYVEEIKPRKTKLLRPPVANVDQVIIVMSLKSPSINLWLLDRFLVMAEFEGIENIVIALSKVDLVENEEVKKIKEIYELAKYKFIEISNLENIGIDQIKNVLNNHITVFAGPSGVGKSTLLNSIDKSLELETGSVSQKTERGKHTTRHVELIELDEDTFVLDTPGFSSLDIDFIDEAVELSHYFKEFIDEDRPCKFSGCLHLTEPGCSVKERVDEGIISTSRYENYKKILDEVKNIRRY